MDNLIESCHYNDRKVKQCLKDISSINRNTEFRRIENDYNKWLKGKQGQKYQRVSLNTYKENEHNHEILDNIIDNEIRRSIRNKQWKNLTMSTRWFLIKDYCDNNNVTEKEKENIKILLKGNESKLAGLITLDCEQARIISIDAEAFS